jgi:hypothetical protein
VIDKNGEWTLIALQTEEGPRVYRIRLQPPTGVTPSEYSNCVIVEWAFEDALPDQQLTQAHRVFDGYMDPLGDNNRNSVLMHVFTRAGMKEWCYYARDYPAFMTDLNTALAGKPRFQSTSFTTRIPLGTTGRR